MNRMVLTASVLLTVTVAAIAQDAKGTNVGQVLPGPFSAFIVGEKPIFKDAQGKEITLTEERQNDGDPGRAAKFHCLITRFGLDPTVAIFSHDPPTDGQPLAKLLTSLESSVVKYKNTRLHAFGIFLTLDKDREFLKDDSRLPKIKAVKEYQSKLKLVNVPLAIDQAESQKTKDFDIQPDDKLVVLLYDNLKVKTRFKFTDARPLDEAGVAEIEAAVKKLIGK